MKKYLILLFILIFVMTAVGCGAKEKVAEKIVEEAVGGDVDIDGDKVTVKGEGGEEVTIGETEWPDSETAKKIPEFKKGKIVSVVSSENALMVAIEEADEKAVADYTGNFLNTFLSNAVIMKSADGIYYAGTNNEGLTIAISYTKDNKSISISANQGDAVQSEPLPNDEFELLSQIASEDLKMPTKGMASKLPSISDGNIESVNYSINTLAVTISDVEKVDFEEYYNKFKSIYSKEGTEMKDSATAFYYATDEEGLGATLNYSFTDKTLNISITKQ